MVIIIILFDYAVSTEESNIKFAVQLYKLNSLETKEVEPSSGKRKHAIEDTTVPTGAK